MTRSEKNASVAAEYETQSHLTTRRSNFNETTQRQCILLTFKFAIATRLHCLANPFAHQESER